MLYIQKFFISSKEDILITNIFTFLYENVCYVIYLQENKDFFPL